MGCHTQMVLNGEDSGNNKSKQIVSYACRVLILSTKFREKKCPIIFSRRRISCPNHWWRRGGWCILELFTITILKKKKFLQLFCWILSSVLFSSFLSQKPLILWYIWKSFGRKLQFYHPFYLSCLKSSILRSAASHVIWCHSAVVYGDSRESILYLILQCKLLAQHTRHIKSGGAGNDCLNLNFRQNFP